ncbi:MAG: hypothetical protein K2R98_32905 [Gemmataceae bacterium]|nr:hypothetical protein [Gemmataceae bacterium]
MNATSKCSGPLVAALFAGLALLTLSPLRSDAGPLVPIWTSDRSSPSSGTPVVQWETYSDTCTNPAVKDEGTVEAFFHPVMLASMLGFYPPSLPVSSTVARQEDPSPGGGDPGGGDPPSYPTDPGDPGGGDPGGGTNNPPPPGNPPPSHHNPEPGTLISGLIGAGLIGLASWKRRRKQPS